MLNIGLFFRLHKPLKQCYASSGKFKIEICNLQLLPAPILASPFYYVNVFFPLFCLFFPPWLVSDESGVAILRFCCKKSRHCNACCCSEYAAAHGSLRWGKATSLACDPVTTTHAMHISFIVLSMDTRTVQADSGSDSCF